MWGGETSGRLYSGTSIYTPRPVAPSCGGSKLPFIECGSQCWTHAHGAQEEWYCSICSLRLRFNGKCSFVGFVITYHHWDDCRQPLDIHLRHKQSWSHQDIFIFRTSSMILSRALLVHTLLLCYFVCLCCLYRSVDICNVKCLLACVVCDACVVL